MTRLVSLVAVLAALTTATACGSSHAATTQLGGSGTTLRVFDPAGYVHAQVTLAGIVQENVRVAAYRPGQAEIYLPLTRLGERQCSRLARADGVVGSQLAVDVAGHIYAVDPINTPDAGAAAHPPVFCGGAPPAIDVRLKRVTAHELVRVLRTTKIVDVSVGAQRSFLTPGPNGASCEIDFDMPYIGSEVGCLGQVRSLADARRAIAARLSASGKVQVCHGMRCVGNSDHPPTLHYGRSISLGPFRCTALQAGVRCVVKTTGRGFLLSAHAVKHL